MSAAKIVSIGEVLWDIFPDGERFGGAPANFACHAAIGGAEVTILSAVGDDSRGREAIRILKDYGIDTTLIQVAPCTASGSSKVAGSNEASGSSAATGTVAITLDQHGKPTFSITEDVAWDQFCWTDQLADRVVQADAVYFGTLAQRSSVARQTIQQCIRVARDAGVPRILDVNFRAPFFDDEIIRTSVELASVLKISDEELDVTASALGILSNDQSETLIQIRQQFALDFVVVTRGADGAMLVSPAGVVSQPGIPTEVLDTVGAGDAFIATFVLGMLGDVEHNELLTSSCQAASAVCGIAGAVPPISNQNIRE